MPFDDAVVTDLDFAVDICLPDDNLDDAQKLLKAVTKYAKCGGFHINVTKIKFCSTNSTTQRPVTAEKSTQWRRSPI